MTMFRRLLLNDPNRRVGFWLSLPLVPLSLLGLILLLAGDTSGLDSAWWLLKMIAGLWTVIFTTYLVRRYLFQPSA